MNNSILHPTHVALRSGLACAVIALACGPAAMAVEKTYSAYRWTPTKLRNDAGANSVQVAEFQFYLAGSPVSWSGATVDNPGGNTPANEDPPKIIDGNTGTKWLDFNKKGLVFTFPAGTTVDAYRFATANDSIERDPVSWTLEGSDDQIAWDLIDVVKNNPTTTDRLTYQMFPLPASLLPEILNFLPTGEVVRDGASSEFSWSVDRADTAVIDHGVGAVDPFGGSKLVDPPDNADTTYTLTASSLGGSSTASLIIRSVIGGTVNTRYVRFTPLKLRAGTTIQLAEFSFLNGTTAVVPTDVTNPGGSNEATADEGALKIIDANTGSKWLDVNMKPLVFDFGATVAIDRYLLTTANDAPERDPLRWIMEASDDGSTWTWIENLTAFDFNLPTTRLTDSQIIPLPGNSVVPLLTASSDFASMLIGESVNLSWSSTGAATLVGDNGLGTLAASGTLAVSPTADTTYTLTATAAGGGTKVATVFIQVANPTVTNIAYADFDSAGAELNLRDSAAVVNAFTTLPQGGNVKRLRVTPDIGSSVGAAWFRYKQPLGSSFDTSFAFQFTTGQPNNGADGMAFVIHNDPRKTETMPTTPQEFGVATNALNISLDSYQNAGEASAARLLVLSGATTLATVNLAEVNGLSLFTTDQGPDLSDMDRTSNPFLVRVKYVPGDLDVYMNNILIVDSLNVNLATIGALDAQNKAYVGFTARTGGSFEAHDITSWTFTSDDYATWVGRFAGLSSSVPGADPDDDGITNLMEYVLNGNPGIAATGMLPTIARDAAQNLVFSFVRRAESTQDTTQVFLSSTDLATWTSYVIPAATGGMAEILPNTPAAGLETVTIKVPASAAANGKLFGRLQVSGQ